MIANLRLNQDEIRKIRNNQLIYELEEVNKAVKKTGNVTGGIYPTIGDLVLIRSEAKSGDYDKYRIIQEILPPPKNYPDQDKTRDD